MSTKPAAGHKGIFRNMSLAIDRYHMSVEAGHAPEKPKPLIDPYIANVLVHLRKLAKPGWLSKSIVLLDAAPPGHCNDLGGLLDDVAVEVSRNWRDPDHRGTLALCGPGRRAAAMFHIFPETLGKDMSRELALLAENSMTELETDTCVVIARTVERWNLPFVATAMMRLDESPPPST